MIEQTVEQVADAGTQAAPCALNGEAKPKPKGRAEERIKKLVFRNRSLDQENQELACQLDDALALNMRLTERLLQLTGGRR